MSISELCTFGDADGAIWRLGSGEALPAGAAQARLGLLLGHVQLSRRRLGGSCTSLTQSAHHDVSGSRCIVIQHEWESADLT